MKSKTDTNFNHKNKTQRETLIKFIFLLLILVAYFLYMSDQYGAESGLLISILTWSFFVLCTPIADGGFILAFPVRLLFHVKMVVTQLITWLLAIGVNIWAFNVHHEIYQKSAVTKILESILATPYPFWGILLISAMGTFLSIYFGDEMMDVSHHNQREKHHQHGFKYRIILVVGLAVLTVYAYYELVAELGIQLPV